MVPPLEITPIMHASDIRAAGVQPRDFAAAIARGEVYQVARALYVSADVYRDADVDLAAACHRTGGVIGMLSAATRHGMCDAAPTHLEVLVAAHLSRPPRELPVRIVRSRDPQHLTLGVDVTDFHGIELRVTDPARTVVDLYRIEPELNRQHAVASLASFMRDEGDERLLTKYARAFGVWDVIGPEVEAIAETYARGMRS